MALDTPFVRFLRFGGKSEFTVSLHRLTRAPERKVTSFNLEPHFQRFLELMEEADAANAAFLDERLGHTDGYNSGSLKQRFYDEFEVRLVATLAVYEREGRARAEIASLIEVDIAATEAWLLRRFENELNEARQRAAGVTHYIWRSADDSKVRSSHAERDDRVFSWDHGFPDGLPGEAHNCRCYVARVGSAKNPQGYVDIDFENGSIVAVYEFPRGLNGELLATEPALVTLFPEAQR